MGWKDWMPKARFEADRHIRAVEGVALAFIPSIRIQFRKYFTCPFIRIV